MICTSKLKQSDLEYREILLLEELGSSILQKDKANSWEMMKTFHSSSLHILNVYLSLLAH